MRRSAAEVLEDVGEVLLRTRFAQQFAALFYKNVLVAWRSRRSTAIRLFAPLFFLLLALVVNLALEANNALQSRYEAAPQVRPAAIGGIPPCGTDLYISGRQCVDFVYSPTNDTLVNRIVDGICANNDPPIPADRVLGFATRSEADDYLGSHPDGALGAVHFTRMGEGLAYVVASNSTVKYFKGDFQDPTTFFSVPLMSAVARELARTYVSFAAEGGGGGAAPAAGTPEGLLLAGGRPPESLTWAPRLAPFPHPSLRSTNLLGQVLSSFIFASLMFGFVTQMSNLVSEKDLGLRLALRNMGMVESAYWASWMLFDALMTLATAALLVAFGMLLRFGYFLRNDFSVLLLLFWLFGLAMTSLSYLLSVLVNKTQGAVYLGFSVFIAGWIFQVVIFLAKLPYSPRYYYSETNPWGRAFFWVFSLMPWNPLTKGILDLNEATLTPGDPGLRFSDLGSYCSYSPDPSSQPPYDPSSQFKSYDCVLPLGQAYLNLLALWAAYWALAVYLNNVLPNEVGARRPLLYFLSPSYWSPRPVDLVEAMHKVLEEDAAGIATPPYGGEEEPEEDVRAEEERMRTLLLERTGMMPPGDYFSDGRGSGDDDDGSGSSPLAAALAPPGPSVPYAAELYGLRRVFKARRPALRPRAPCLNAHSSGGGGEARGPPADYWAIKGTWLGIREGQLLCLLGPNGAGKTTTINCLTGVLPYTGGEALIYGQPIGNEGGLDAVRPLMGVCPQFDVLWGELTGAEHLAIYGHIKGLPVSQVRAQAALSLERVQLTYASKVRSSSYSGGMKRRLSVAIALLGDPKIVYLDEPTTGMDPISRRYVWDIIQEAKHGRAIVLTTHSMEEADILGDTIAIMARGRLRAIGSSVRLKQKFGSGYQLTVHMATPGSASYASLSLAEQGGLQKRMDGIKAFFRQGMGLEPEQEGRALLHYLVPRSKERALQGFLGALEHEAERLGVADLQCSLASLEEVFLTIARRAELEAAAQSGSSLVAVDLPDGGELVVPLGEEEVQHPSGDGRSYRIKWTQDDAGRLVVLDCALLPALRQPPSPASRRQAEAEVQELRQLAEAQELAVLHQRLRQQRTQ